MSPSPSAKSSSHNAPNPQDPKNEQNCKVYVSNINRFAQNEEIRQTFEKFGKITYFEIKRKPQDVVYAFIEYSTHQQANEAVTKMDKTIFMKRTLNVQFGRGGKHQQTHYKPLILPPLKYRDFNSRDREGRQRRSSSSYDRYEHRRKSDKLTRRGSRSPTRNNDNSRKDYREDRPRQRYRDDHRRQNSRDRGHGHYDSNRKHFNEKDYHKDEKRYQQRNSPQKERGEKRLYDDEKYPQRKYDDKRRIDDRQKQHYRGKDRYSHHEDNQQRDKVRCQDQRRRKSPDIRQRNRDRYLDERHHRKERREQKSLSPRKDQYSRHHRPRQEERRRFDDRHRERRERDGYSREREREPRRSRSRDKSLHKHKSHRRDKYQDDAMRKQSHHCERQNSRGRRSPHSPRRNDDRKRRHSRSEERKRRPSRSEERRRNSRQYSPFKAQQQKKYSERNQQQGNIYRQEEFRRYPQPYIKTQRPYQNNRPPYPRQAGMEQPVPPVIRKNSKISHQSREKSPQQARSMVDQSQKNMRFSSEKEISPRPSGVTHAQSVM